MKKLNALFSLSVLAALATAASAGPVEVHDTYLKFENKNYFVAGSDTVTMGAYGAKKSPVGKANYLEVKDALAPAKLDGRITTASIVTIDFANSSKADVSAAASAAKVVNSNVAVTYEHLKDGSLKLVHLVMMQNDAKAAVNASPSALKDLASYGGEARVAYEIFVVMDATMADKVTTATQLSVSGTTTTGIKLTASGGGSSSASTEVTLSAGTTFAYFLGKPIWNKDKSALTDLEDDQAHSLN